ncbi:unnamed protein product [Ambrosiozyma monospora]|uniref:Unnamed protein product n=1 Tax=Ambrosiozyma monospora TaxID=43982 RepID=A0A9W6Z5V8_AMBMO|nr:unnamed protein product [Ambrosiozyma monospora]
MAKFCKTDEKFMTEWSLSKIQTILQNVKKLLTLPSSSTNFELQKLRKCFLGILESFHQEIFKIDQVEQWIPLQFRKDAFEFGEEWCGYGDSIALFNKRYAAMTKEISTSENSVTLQASLELQKRQLQYTAISCMASLLGSPIADSQMTFDVNRLLLWFDALFNTHNEKVVDVARKALLKLLEVNSDSTLVIHEILNKCYTHDPALGNYFIMVNEAYVNGTNFADKYYSPLSLAMFACGSENFSVRAAATRMLEHAENQLYGTNKSSTFVDGICSGSRIIYKRTLFQLSTSFANDHPEEKFNMISQITMLFGVVSTSDARRDLLAVLLPWVQTVELKLTDDEDEVSGNSSGAEDKEIVKAAPKSNSTDRNNSLMVLYNFLEITMKFGHKIQNEVEALWVALGNGGGNGGSNCKVIYDFVVDICLQSKNLELLECCRQVIVSLSSVTSSFNLIDDLIGHLEPKSMIPAEREITYVAFTALTKPDSLPYVADLSAYVEKKSINTIPTLSLCELSVVFLVDLILNPVDSVKEQLPLLLHLSFVLLDHQLPLIQDQACTMVAHLIRQYGDYSDETTRKIVDTLTSHERQKNLWLHIDLITDKNGGRIPESMDLLVRDVKKVLEPNIPNIQKEWSKSAIHWATSCKVMHIASRSFQVFRCLISFLDQSMLRDMLSCLANTVSDENPGIQSFALQILMTLNAITAELYSEQLIDFPQLFWSAVASLNTIHEHEFIEVLSTLSKFISKIDLDSEDTVQCLIATFPPKWED